MISLFPTVQLGHAHLVYVCLFASFFNQPTHRCSCHAWLGPNVSPTNSGLAAYRCVCPSGLTGHRCQDATSQGPQTSPSQPSPPTHTAGLFGCHAAQLIVQEQRQQSSNQRQSPSRPDPQDEPVCLNEGQCVERTGGPSCICHTGWQGARCEHDINECQLARSILTMRQQQASSRSVWRTQSDPASTAPLSGELCSQQEPGRGVCVNTLGSYQCNCSLGFTGRHCESKVRRFPVVFTGVHELVF